MKIINNLQEICKNENIVLTIGNFDGVHLGHKKLINEINLIKKNDNDKTLLIIFEPQPVEYFSKIPTPRISSYEQKIYLLKLLNLDYLYVITFNKEFAHMNAQDFIKFLVNNINLKHIHIGHDFHFGYKREGNYQLLKDFSKVFNYNVTQSDVFYLNNIRVSSTHIRNLLQLGLFQEASTFLGYDYNFQGKVIHSKKLARTIGFPTANILVNNNSPLSGVYAVKVIINNQIYYGVSNIGINPTINDTLNIKCDTYIFDFNANIYGEIMQIVFLKKIREEQKFDNLQLLKDQISLDIDNAKQISMLYR